MPARWVDEAARRESRRCAATSREQSETARAQNRGGTAIFRSCIAGGVGENDRPRMCRTPMRSGISLALWSICHRQPRRPQSDVGQPRGTRAPRLRPQRRAQPLPRSRGEDGQIREWAQTHAFDFTEAARRPGKRKGDPDQVYWTAPAPIPTSEGHRIVWVRSSDKHDCDAEARRARIERGMLALEAVQAKLASPRSRIKTLVAADEAAHDALAQTGAARWIAHDIQESIQEGFRQEKRGRPGRDTRYRKTEKTVFTLTFKIDEQKVAYDAATDGCFPLVSNDRDLTDPELLGAYRYQPNLEKRHHQLKTVLAAAPVTLKSPSRIEGLACCEFIALLCQCLIER